VRLRLTLAVLASAALVLPAATAGAESTRELRVQLSGDPGRAFAVENLAGTMTVSVGSSDAVVAVATVHAESEELAAAMRFEQVAGRDGWPTLRVRYPVDRHRSFRYGAAHSRGGGDGVLSWLETIAGALGANGNTMEYDGTRVSVSGNRGVVLYADVDVQVPRRALEAAFRNRVGPVSADGVRGRLRFDTGSGTITVRALDGEVVADTGSGDVHANDLKGSFTCDTGSGNCNVTGFSGESLSCDTGSGDVRVVRVDARKLKLDTGSGNVRVQEAEAEELVADTGSGDVEVDLAASRLERVNAETGSGNVRLRLGQDASFHVQANTGSGDVISRYADAEAIRDGRKVVGYRRGDGRIRIHADTGSGDVVLEP
jgi:putative adhesin